MVIWGLSGCVTQKPEAIDPLSFHFISDEPTGIQLKPRGSERTFYLEIEPELRSRHFKRVFSATDLPSKQHKVVADLTEEGRAKLRKLSRNNKGRSLGLLLFGELQNEVKLEREINRSKLVLASGLTREEAEDLVALLRQTRK